MSLVSCESAPAQTASAAPQSGCTELRPPAGSAAAVASQCSDRADDSDILGREAALASYHAATAYNDLGDHDAAARMAASSFDKLPTNDSWLTTPPAGLSEKARKDWIAQRRQVQLGRYLQSAEAYQGLAESFGNAGATAASAPCSSRQDCLGKAISRLSEGETIAAALAGSSETPRSGDYDNYYLMMADLYQARGGAADMEPAISAYQRVSSSPLGGTSAATARANLAAMTSTLGLAASKRDTASDTAQAIRYLTLAREAQPGNTEAILGLAQLYLRLGRESGDVVQLRQAETAFTDALGAASADAQKAAAYSGRGAARDQLAGLLGTSRQGAIDDYAAASQLANSADAFLTLARACADREDWTCADENYGKGVTRLKADSASGAALADALVAQAAVRGELATYGPGDVRALLQQAVSANATSGDAVLALARHDMQAGNWAEAETGFKRLVGTGMQGAAASRAEAYSQLSRLAASRPGGSLELAVSHADQAVQLDSANPDYRRQACLARIHRGSTSVTTSENASKCALGSSAEESLLHAMFEMRKAQYAGANGAAQIRRDARDHADTALAQVTPGQTTDFDWPLAGSLQPVKTRAILLYLKEATLACGGNYSFNLPETDGITASDYSAARGFLDHYKSRLCT